LPAGSTAKRSKQATQLAIEVAPNFVEIWWTGIGTTTLALWTLALWVLPRILRGVFGGVRLHSLWGRLIVASAPAGVV